MSVARTAADAIRDHVTLELECLDRMYLNAYVPQLQRGQGAYSFFHYHRKENYASATTMAPMSRAFVGTVERFAKENEIPLITFEHHQRKDDVAAEYRARFRGTDGVVFIGKAQEKTRVLRTYKRRNTGTGAHYVWMDMSTAMVNQYYFYAIDDDFGPFFLKFGSYFPYTAKLCINGHEYLKRQLTKEHIEFDALDNGLLRCADPQRAQVIANELSAEKIENLFRKWHKRLPDPFSSIDHETGYNYALSILQAEFSLTQVFDHPVAGRIFFENTIREHLDLGRPSQVQLVFDRRVTRSTPGRFRTRIITKDVFPSLHVDYKHSRIKQYFKEGRALRTETTINDTRDFAIGRRLSNLSRLREIGFQANRRLLDVQTISQHCSLDEDAFLATQRPIRASCLRVPPLRFADERVQAVLHALLLFKLLPYGFTNRQLRDQVSALSPPGSPTTQGRMTYDLRRLRHHRLIERIPKSHRYRLTQHGLRTALFFCVCYDRVLRPAAARLSSEAPSPLRASLHRFEAALEQWSDRINPRGHP